MEIIVDNTGLKLIKKHEKYYIRFIGGQYEEYPCDLLITDDEAENIISDNSKIRMIRDSYKRKMSWTLSTFVDTTIRDYMRSVCNMTEKRAEKNMEQFNRHNDIKMEFYEALMYEQFPINNPITVEGYTAKELHQNHHLSIFGAYNYLIYLREDPGNAIKDLQRSLPIK